MIKSITLGNYRSFKSQQTLEIDSSDNGNVSVVFGQNASGKTNILRALDYLRFAVNNDDTVRKLTTRNPVLQPFLLNEKSADEPILFEIKIVSRNVEYRYGFEVSPKKDEISSEWLFETAKRTQRTTERLVFTRENGLFAFNEGARKLLQGLEKNIPHNILAINKFAKENHKESQAIAGEISNNLILFDAANVQSIEHPAYSNYTKNPELLERATKVVKKLDFAINKIDVDHRAVSEDELEKSPIASQIKGLRSIAGFNEPVYSTSVKTWHNVYDADGNVVGDTQFDLATQESKGTNNLIPFLAMVLHAMDNGMTVVVDEFGSGWHPFISSYLTRMFNKKEHSGRFVLLTHDTYLLGRNTALSKDQIWFVDKDRTEQSNLVCLAQYKPRGDVRYEKQYLEGRFGAVPTVLDWLN